MKKLLLLLLVILVLIALSEAAKESKTKSKGKGKSKAKSKSKGKTKTKTKSSKGKGYETLKIDLDEICDPSTTSAATKTIWGSVSTTVKTAFKDGTWTTALDFSVIGIPQIPLICWPTYINKLTNAKKVILLNIFAATTSNCRILQYFYNGDVFKGLTTVQLTALKDNVFMCASTTIMKSWTKEVFTSFLSRYAKIGEGLSATQIKYMLKLVKKHYPRVNTNALFDKIKAALPCMPREICKTIPESVLIAKMADWKDISGFSCKSKKYGPMSRKSKFKSKYSHKKYSCERARMECAKEFAYTLKKGSADSSTWLTSLLKTSFADCIKVKDYLTKLDCKDIPNRGCYPPRLIAEIKKKCKTTKTLSSLTEAEVRADFCTNGGLTLNSLTTLQSLPKAGLCADSCLTELCPAETACSSYASAGRYQKRYISNRCLLTSSLTSSAVLQKLECGCLPLTQRYINALTTDDQCRALKKRLDKCKDASYYSVIKCVRQLLKKDGLASAKDLVAEFPPRQLCKDSTVAQIKTFLGSGEISASRDQIICMAKRIVDNIAATEIPSIISQYQILASEIYRMKRASIDIEAVADRKALAVQICQKLDNTDSEEAEGIRDLIVQGLTDTSTTTVLQKSLGYMESLSEADIAELSDNCLSLLQVKELAASKSCTSICQKIASRRKYLCREEKDRCTQYATQCMKCLVGGVDSAPTALTFEGVETLQNFLCCLSDDDFKKVEQVTENRARIIAMLSKCPTRDVFTAYVRRYTAAVIADELSELPTGTILATIETAATATERTTLLQRIADNAVEIVAQTKEALDRGYCDIREQEDSRSLYLLIKKSVVSTISVSARRKKRNANAAYTCVTLETMQDAAETFTEDEWKKFSASELSQCLELIGNLKLSQPITQLLYSRVAKELTTDGKICSATEDQLTAMNSLASAATPADLKCLKNMNIDVMTVLGNIHTWSAGQIKALAEIAKDTLKLTLSSGTNVASVGHVLCGYAAADIEGMTSDVYQESERKLDMLKICARDRLMALRKVAVRDDNRGPVMKWTSVDYVISGLLLSTFSADELKNAQAYISDWKEDAIKHIRGEDLKFVSDENMKKLKSKLSKEQLDNLSPEQKKALGIHVPPVGAASYVGAIIPLLLVSIAAVCNNI